MGTGATEVTRGFQFTRSISILSEHDSDFEDLPEFPTPETPYDEKDAPSSANHVPDGLGQGGLEFSAIHGPPQPFTTIRKNCWIPNTPVYIKIIDAERHNAHIKVFNPTLYTVQITHGDFQWTVRRRFKHFDNLHSALRSFRMQRRIPLPTKAHYEKRKSVRGRKNRIPRFPKKPEILIRDIAKRRRHLEEYLQNLVNLQPYREHFETMKFLEVSHLSFIKKLGKKYKEGPIMKCSGGRHISIGCCGCLKRFHLAGRWNKRWLLVKDSFVAYVRPRDGRICDVMLMDRDFSVDVGMGSTGAHHGLLITSLTRNLLAKCWTRRKAEEWKKTIEDAVKTTGKEYTQENRFQSFAPVREPSYAKWFADGATYFSAVADALDSAKEEIFITDWWLSPEVYLKRPITDGNRWRLDVLLERKANEGVKVFVLLYKEMTMAVNLSSNYSKHVLMSKSNNIKVLRHPDHIGSGVYLWAHHEKLVVVDQKIAFVGGIDLCYGRWDNAQHKLTDLGCIVYESSNQNVPKGEMPELPKQPPEEEEEDFLEHSGISLKIVPPSPSASTEEIVPAPPPLPTDGSTSQDVVQQEVVIDQEQKKEEEEKDLEENECSCHKCRTSENRHSYSNSSVEEEEYTSLINSSKEKKSTRDNHEVVKVLVHQDSLGSVPLRSGSHNIPGGSNNEALCSEIAAESFNLVGKSESKDVTKVKDQCNKKVNFNEEFCVQKEDSSKGAVETSSPKKHLWNISARRSSPAKSSKHGAGASGNFVDIANEHSQDKKVQLKSYKRTDSSGKYITDENGDSILLENEALNQEDRVILRPQESQELKSAKQEGGKHDSWAIKKLRRSLSRGKEQNNNNGDHTDHGDDQTDHLVRKWRLVLNIQKFESAVRRPQEQTPYPDCEEKLPSPRLRDKIRQNLHDRFKSHHRDSLSESLDDMKEDLKPPPLQRTSSEINIDQLGLKGSSKLWIGKDYVNFIFKDFQNLEKPFEDFIDRSATPRMPWHDIASVVYGKAARDVARHFIGRWNFTKVEKAKRNKDYPLLVPKAYGHHYKIPPLVHDLCDEVKTQILRSACDWSAGIRRPENSIHSAYISCIENAKHYIYIENQFFISIIEDHRVVKNKISETLLNRIVKAHKNNETFRVFVMMPLLPAFEGNIGESGGYAIKAITHWNYLSIAKGPNSIWQRLVKEVIDPLKYIVFCGLRTHGELSGKLVSELVYVHSKLMIVDDDTVIIGSANINDRSMSGECDSEVAVLVEDIHKTRVSFNGTEHMAGKFATSLRKRLFSEHLGLSPTDPVLDDPVSDQFYKRIWVQQATINTTVFQKVFNCVPDDKILSYAEFEDYKKQMGLAETDIDAAQKLLAKVKGYVVLLPLHFLELENSIIPVARESFLPNSVWV